MLVLSKRNIIISSPDGSASVTLKRDGLAQVPEWAVKTAYFRALVADGKIVPTTNKDKDTQAAAEKKVKTRRGKETTEE